MLYPGSISSKLPRSGTTIFAIMSALANECGAINLSQGFPDFPVDEELMDKVFSAMKSGHNQYAPMPGILPLRESIAAKMQALYGAAYDAGNEITVTSGGTEALYAAITSMVRPGDEVIVFEPAYDCYVPAIELAGGLPVYITLKYPRYAVDWDEVRSRITPRTRCIVINTPQNPTATVWSAEDMNQLEAITDGTDIVVISDEVYEHILFDGLQHISVCSRPSLAARSFAVFSFGKTYHATGWKMGYCLAPANLMAEFRKCHQFIVFSSHTPTQYALASVIQEKDRYLRLASFYQGKRDYFLQQLAGSPFTHVPASGSYFQLLDYSAISAEKDSDMAVRLTREAGVASIPMSSFYHQPTTDRVLRFCFAKKEETLKQAAQRLQQVLA